MHLKKCKIGEAQSLKTIMTPDKIRTFSSENRASVRKSYPKILYEINNSLAFWTFLS